MFLFSTLYDAVRTVRILADLKVVFSRNITDQKTKRPGPITWAFNYRTVLVMPPAAPAAIMPTGTPAIPSTAITAVVIIIPGVRGCWGRAAMPTPLLRGL